MEQRLHNVKYSFRLNYLTLLFRTEKYDELVTTFLAFSDPTLSQATLAMAALVKVGTNDAFVQATEILRQSGTNIDAKSRKSGGRMTALYAFFAIKVYRLNFFLIITMSFIYFQN
jgi:hypothetical protein